MMVCVCCVPAQQCCCDESGPRILQGDDECSNATFPVPSPPKTTTLIFEWCGLVGEQALQGGQQSFFFDQVIDDFVCNTTGRYGAEASYTRATRKALSVDPVSFTGSNCGVSGTCVVSVIFEGVGFKQFGDGNFYGVESVIVVELYGCNYFQCFDGGESVVNMTLTENTPDDTCGGTGNFDPCKFTAPELTIVVAP